MRINPDANGSFYAFSCFLNLIGIWVDQLFVKTRQHFGIKRRTSRSDI